MKPLKHTNKVRVCTYLKPDCQQLIDSLALELNKTASVAIALIIEQHKLISERYPSVIYQASLEKFPDIPGYKLYQIYISYDLAYYIKEIADTKNLSESEATNSMIREWNLINSKYHHDKT